MRQDEGQGAGATPANFVAVMSWPDVAARSHEAKRSILNFFATAPGSACDPAVTSALGTSSPFSGASDLCAGPDGAWEKMELKHWKDRG